MQTSARPAGVKIGDVLYDDFYEYILTVTFAGTENQQTSIQIQADAHFVAVAGYMNSSLASGAGTFQGSGVNRGGSLVQLSDISTGRSLSNAQVPANCLFGSAQQPFVWPLRHMFRASGGIGFSVSGTAGAQVVDYVIGGFKIPAGSAPQYGL